MKEYAIRLIGYNSKTWLADTLGISLFTLNKRLELDNWKKSEIAMLINLNKAISEAE